jgi:hypothetical protein
VTRPWRLVHALALVLAGGSAAAAQSIHGMVVDQTDLPLPGVRLELIRDAQSQAVTVSGGDGHFELPASGPTDIVQATLDGFAVTRVTAAADLRIVMPLDGVHDRTEVTASALTVSGVTMESIGALFASPLALRVPTARPRALASLPLLPSVVRGPDGLLRLDGTRPHEAMLLIDGFNVTDPVSGTTAIDLPLESVKGVAVLRDPMSVAFGGTLGALASIETVGGGEHFGGGIQGFIPRPRLSKYGFGHIEGFFPRAYLGGRHGAVRYFAAEEFDFEHVPVPGVTTRGGGPNIGEMSATTFVRLDVAWSVRSTLTIEGLVVPGHTAFAGLSPLRERSAAPTIQARDLFTGVTERFVASATDVVTIRAGVLSHATRLAGHGSGATRLTPVGWRDNWFASIDHRAARHTLAASWDHRVADALGAHALTASAEFEHRAMAATLAQQAIHIEDGAGALVRSIDFGETPHLRSADRAGSIAMSDRWAAGGERLQLDLGARLDWSGPRVQQAVSPRLGVRYAIDQAGATVLKGGVGRFVGRIPLGALAFDKLPVRTDSDFDVVSGERQSVSSYRPVLDALHLPRADTATIALEQRLGPGLDVLVGARRRTGSRLATVDAPVGGPDAALSSTGTSVYREIEIAGRRSWSEDRQLFISYVRSATHVELNDFGTLFADLATPQLEPNAKAVSAADAPNRWVGWGTFALARGFVVSPAAEWHTGFPYSAFDSRRHYEGAANSRRLPAFFSLDMTAYKTVELLERQVNLGLQLFNVTGHFNPRDVSTVVGTPQFGRCTNSVGLTVGGYMMVKWQ